VVGETSLFRGCIFQQLYEGGVNKMLYNVNKGIYVKTIPHYNQYKKWKSKMSADEVNAIFDELNSRFDVNEVETSSWIPGSDWTGTVFQPIYEKACRSDEIASGLCFGLMVWEAMMNHPEVWGFGRYEKDGIPIQGITYFRLNRIP